MIILDWSHNFRRLSVANPTHRLQAVVVELGGLLVLLLQFVSILLLTVELVKLVCLPCISGYVQSVLNMLIMGIIQGLQPIKALIIERKTLKESVVIASISSVFVYLFRVNINNLFISEKQELVDLTQVVIFYWGLGLWILPSLMVRSGICVSVLFAETMALIVTLFFFTKGKVKILLT